MDAPIVTRVGPQVGGLQPALNLLLKTASASSDPQQPEEEQRRLVRAALLPVIVQEIRVRDAGPFLQMMRLPLAGPGFDVERVLPNRQAIENVADAANLVLLLVDPVLPCLLRLPTDATHLRVVDASAVNLRDFACAAGGSFKAACTEFAQKLTLYTDAASAHPVFSPYAPLRATIDDLLRDARRFLNTTFTVKHPDAKEATAAAVEVAAAAAAAAAAMGGGNAPGAEAEGEAGGQI